MSQLPYFSFFNKSCIYLFLAVLHLCCCITFLWLQWAGSFSCCEVWVFDAWASVIMAFGPKSHYAWALEPGLSSCGTGLSCPWSMGDLPGPGIKLVSPASAGGVLTTGPPGKSFLTLLEESEFYPTFQSSLVGLSPNCPSLTILLTSFFFSISHTFSPVSASWDHLPNNLPTLK